MPAGALVPVSSVIRDDVVLGVPAPKSSEGFLTRRQRRRLNEKAKKAALLENLPPDLSRQLTGHAHPELSGASPEACVVSVVVDDPPLSPA
jgi:hypothetical protein